MQLPSCLYNASCGFHVIVRRLFSILDSCLPWPCAGDWLPAAYVRLPSLMACWWAGCLCRGFLLLEPWPFPPWSNPQAWDLTLHAIHYFSLFYCTLISQDLCSLQTPDLLVACRSPAPRSPLQNYRCHFFHSLWVRRCILEVLPLITEGVHATHKGWSATKICSEKVKDHRSTSRVISLSKRMIRLICHQREKHP